MTTSNEDVLGSTDPEIPAEGGVVYRHGRAPKADWEAIEGHFRAGIRSLKNIAAEHGITEGAIRKYAKRRGWTRDLGPKVKQAAAAELALQGLDRRTDPRVEAEIVASAASSIVDVVVSHRRDIQAGRAVAARLMATLAQSLDDSSRNEIIAAIQQETAAADDDAADPMARSAARARRRQMLAAVELPTQSGVVKDLTVALGNLVKLERLAFSIDDAPLEAPADTPGASLDGKFAELRQRIDGLANKA